MPACRRAIAAMLPSWSCGAVPVLLLLPVCNASCLPFRRAGCRFARRGARRKAYVWWRTAVGRQSKMGVGGGQEDMGGGAALQWKPAYVPRSCTGKCVCACMCIVCNRIPCALDTRARLCLQHHKNPGFTVIVFPRPNGTNGLSTFRLSPNCGNCGESGEGNLFGGGREGQV